MENKYLLNHNKELYEQMESMLSEHGKACIILGTGLGKTTTALQYLHDHQIRGLVICPQNNIKKVWDDQMVDTITYTSFLLNHDKIEYYKYGLIIVDEAHHMGAEKWGQDIKYLMDHKIIRVLGLTATPIRSDYIDIRKFFGGCICYGMDILSGIKKGLLYPFSYVGAYYNTVKYVDGVLTQYPRISDTLRARLDLEINNTPTVASILRQNMPAGKRKGIIFVGRISEINEAKDLIQNIYPEAPIKVLHSQMSIAAIREAREWFKEADEGYLITIYMMGEGVHDAGVNTLIMLRRTSSNLVFMQQLGRCLTLTKNENPHAIVFDLVNNARIVERFITNMQQIINPKGKEGKETLRYSSQVIIKSYTRGIDEVLAAIKKAYDNTWSDEEIQILRNYYAEHAKNPIIKDLLSLLPKRSEDGIKAMVSRLHLSTSPSVWTEEENDILRKYYVSEGTMQVSQRLKNRTISGIQSQANKLGLTRIGWSEKEIQLLRELYPINGANIPELLTTKSRRKIMRYAKKLGIICADDRVTVRLSCEDRELIKLWYPIEGAKCVERLSVKRDEKSISRLANKMGVSAQKRIPIRCVETQIVYKAIYEAERLTGVSSKSIARCLQRKDKFAGGYHWEYVEKEE